MTPSGNRAQKSIDSGSVSIHFSDQARGAFRDLAALVHFHSDFDDTAKSILDDIVAKGSIGLDGFLAVMPLIAQETFRYKEATKDARVEKIWREIALVFSEVRYTLSQSRQTGVTR